MIINNAERGNNHVKENIIHYVVDDEPILFCVCGYPEGFDAHWRIKTGNDHGSDCCDVWYA